MYKSKSVAVIIPSFNEQVNIEKVINSMPEYVDRILVINDCSTDKTREIVEENIKNNSKILLINHEKNQGVGATISTGCKWTLENNIDITVGMAGDAQMEPKDMSNLLDVIIEDKADYVKGNRPRSGDIRHQTPWFRYYGNQILSLLTKVASGYWHVADPQNGYCALNRKVLEKINWSNTYSRYGFYNDLLVKMNIENLRVKEVSTNAYYNVGEVSGIKVRKFMFTLSALLAKQFLFRLKEKYIVRDFHPLVFFYLLGGFFGVTTIGLAIRVVYVIIEGGQIPSINALAAFFSFMSASLFTLFAMWFDMSYNRELKGSD